MTSKLPRIRFKLQLGTLKLELDHTYPEEQFREQAMKLILWTACILIILASIYLLTGSLPYDVILALLAHF